MYKSIYSAIDSAVVEDITILSIGTGDVYDGRSCGTRIIPFEKLQNSGTIQWAQPLVGILLSKSAQ